MNKKGFTLIELLAVIIILGILMIIAIPSVTRYISDSRKSAYIDTAKEIIGSVRNVVNEGKLGMYDTSTTYYIPINAIETENALKSPYGNFTEAYVAVTYNGKGYKYYWISVDETGQGVPKIIQSDILKTDDIKSDIKDSDVEDIVKHTVIGNRTKIEIYDPIKNIWEEPDGEITNHLTEEGNEITDIAVYPIGKTKSSVVTGDLVTIGTEDFYVVKHNGNDLILLARYNLNVGSNKKTDVQEGIQNSDVRGLVSVITNDPRYGIVPFSNTNYWAGKVGTEYPGEYCTTYELGHNCAYVYDSNSNVYQYVENYKSYLEGLGEPIKEARLLKFEEILELGCEDMFCETVPEWVKGTSYWLGTTSGEYYMWRARTNSTVYYNSSYSDNAYHGVRPVIVI